MHRRDRTCHWCGDRAHAARSSTVTRSISGIAAVALVAVGSWSMREQAADILEEAIAVIKSPAPPTQSIATTPAQAAPTVSVPVPSPVIDSTATLAVAQAPEAIGDSVHVASAEGARMAADTIRWVPAVARTWVNVRADASREGDVVGVIKPADKAMLGIGRSGWRQVKSTEVTGWVDPRLFEADSLRTRG